MDNVLFLGAHPDDIEINAGGIIHRILSEGDASNIHCIVLAASDKDRVSESVKSFYSLGIDPKNCDYETFEDTKLFKSLHLIINYLDNYIKKNNIDCIFTHYPYDTHQDHQTVSKAALAVSRNLKGLYFFKPTAPAGKPAVPFDPNTIFKLDECDIRSKIEALSRHVSQVKKYGAEDWLKSIEMTAKSDAWVHAGIHGYAEVFMLHRIII